MAMRTSEPKRGGGDFEEFSQPDIVSEINITPLTDVFLVLLIIFMVTSSVMSQMGVQVQLPQSKHAATASQQSATLVTVTSSGDILINGQRVPESALGNALKAAMSKSADKTIVLEGDRRALLGTIVKIMDEGKKAGATKFAVATKGD